MVESHKILFFDGECNLCNQFIDFLIQQLNTSDNTKKVPLLIASLQGETAQKLLGPAVSYDSIVLWSSTKVYTRSAAAIRAISLLGGPYSLSIVFLIAPSFIRDTVYNWVAKNRYTWFGRRQTCRIPTEYEKNYFLP